MDLKQLRYFEKVAEYENISKAAAELYISQPALTKSIQQLELELNTKLFDRHGHKIELNESGKLTLEYVHRILSNADELCRLLGDSSQTSGSISICTTQSFLARYLLPRFTVEYPQFPLHYRRITIDDNPVQLLTSREADIVILPELLNVPGICSTFFLEEKMMLCVPENHPLAKKNSILLDDLQNMSLLITQANIQKDPYTRRFISYSQQQGVTYQYIEQTDFATIRYLMQTSNICNILSDREWALDSHPNRVAVPIQNEIAINRSFLCYLESDAARLKPILRLLKRASLRK